MSAWTFNASEYEGRDSSDQRVRLNARELLRNDAPLLLAEVVRQSATIAQQAGQIARLRAALKSLRVNGEFFYALVCPDLVGDDHKDASDFRDSLDRATAALDTSALRTQANALPEGLPLMGPP